MPNTNIKPISKRTSSVTLSVFHLPLLLIVGGLIAVYTLAPSTFSFLNKYKDANTNVLGDDDEDEDKGDKEDKEDKEDKKDESKKKEDEKKKEQEKKEAEKRKEEQKKSTKPVSRITTPTTFSKEVEEQEDNEDEDRFEEYKLREQEQEDETTGEDSLDNEDEEKETMQVVSNPDGTTSYIKTKFNEGETKYEVKTFDAAGTKISVEKYEGNDGEQKSKVTFYDALGNKVKDLRLETSDGKKLELRVSENGKELSKVVFDADNQEIVVKNSSDVLDPLTGLPVDSTENSLTIRLEGNNFMLSRKGIDALSKFPLVVDDTTGVVSVQTSNGEVVLGMMPDSIVDRAKASADLDSVNTVSLDSDNDTTGTGITAPLEFKLTGTKSEKLLGLFTIQIPSEVIYDAQTGGFLRSNSSFVSGVLDLFSF